jgi:hypothetical protein
MLRSDQAPPRFAERRLGRVVCDANPVIVQPTCSGLIVLTLRLFTLANLDPAGQRGLTAHDAINATPHLIVIPMFAAT